MTFKPSFRNRVIAALGALVLAAGAQAAAPQVKTQAPGFYRTMLGDFEVTALFDGVIELTPKELLPNTTHTVESKGQKLVLWGDLMHVAAVQFVQPQVTISFDIDSKAAAVQRKKAYADAVKGRYLVGSAHLPFPGLGHLRADGKGYAWVPVDYAPVAPLK